MSRAGKASEATSTKGASPTKPAGQVRGRSAVPPLSGVAFVDARSARSQASQDASLPFLQRACKCGAKQGAPCDACKEKHFVQRAAAATGGGAAAAPAATAPGGGVASVLASGGTSLSPALRGPMERSFGRDLGGVRIHTGPDAAASAESLGARAYTVGDHIVFNRDEFQPHTRQGKHLLAHELAHTVQQAGLQRSARDAAVSPASEAHLEAEADRAADAVVRGGAPPRISHVGGAGPLLQRAKQDNAKPGAVRTWSPIAGGAAHPAKMASGVESFGNKRAQAFLMKAEFPLPEEKGAAAYALWKARADAGALETVWETKGSEGKVELYQARDKTDELKQSWLEKVGWARDDKSAIENWKAARDAIPGATPKKEKADSEFKPRVAKPDGEARTCHMDHVVELQMQGTNVPSNVAVLDGSENSSSGSQIASYIRSVANELEALTPNVDVFIISFDRVAKPKKPANDYCTRIEDLVASGAFKPKNAAKTPDNMEPYEMTAGGSKASAFVSKGGTDDDISKEGAARIIPGLALHRLKRTTANKDAVTADFDTAEGTRIPITLGGETAKTGAKTQKAKGASGGIVFDVAKEGAQKGLLTLNTSANKDLPFTYPYLSTGTITKLEVLQSGGIAGEGILVPSIPLLKRLKLKVAFAPNHLSVSTDLKNPDLEPPMPGFKVTKAELALLLHPEFKPTGRIEFEVSRGKKKFVEGNVEVGADAEGFYAKGLLRGFIPGTDDATGTFIYRKSGWRADLHVGASDIKLPIPGVKVKSGAVDAHITAKGVSAEGRIVFALPGNQEAELGVEHNGTDWIFKGKGRFNVPGLKSFDANVEYDGKKVKAWGSTTMSYRGFDAAVSIHYVDGKIHGKGTLDFQKGRVKGHAEVEVDDNLKLSGKGGVTVRINESLEAQAAIDLKKDGSVRVVGEIAITKPIILFKGYGNKINLFSLKKTIPIPGLSIGPLGAQAVLGASLDAHYNIGPAALVDTTLTLALNPFDDKPDPDIGFKSRLSLPASAGIAVTITGGLELEAGLARAGGEISVKGGADISANAGADLVMRYYQKQLDVKGAAVLDAGLVLNLGVAAAVYGEVGVWKFKSRWEKTWQLYDKRFDTGLKLRIKAPFGYTSAGGAKLPSMNEIEITKPSLSVGPMIDQLVRESRQQEKEKK